MKNPRGRPPMPPSETASKNITVRLSQADRDKFHWLGGTAWLRAKIRAARAPARLKTDNER